MFSNRKHTHHHRFSFWNFSNFSIEDPSYLLLNLPLLCMLTTVVGPILILLRLLLRGSRSSRNVGVILPRIRALFCKMTRFPTIITRKIVALWRGRMNTLGTRLLWVGKSCSRTYKCLRPRLKLLWTIRRAIVVLQDGISFSGAFDCHQRIQMYYPSFSFLPFVGDSSPHMRLQCLQPHENSHWDKLSSFSVALD